MERAVWPPSQQAAMQAPVISFNTNTQFWIEGRVAIDGLVEQQRRGECLVAKALEQVARIGLMHGRDHQNACNDQRRHVLVGRVSGKPKTVRLQVPCKKLEKMARMVHRH